MARVLGYKCDVTGALIDTKTDTYEVVTIERFTGGVKASARRLHVSQDGFGSVPSGGEHINTRSNGSKSKK